MAQSPYLESLIKNELYHHHQDQLNNDSCSNQLSISNHEDYIDQQVDALLKAKEASLDAISQQDKDLSLNVTLHQSNSYQQKKQQYEPGNLLPDQVKTIHLSDQKISNPPSSNTNEDIIRNLRHDLRNSLHPIINLLPILYSNVELDENNKIIQVLNRNMENLQNLVDKSITLSQIKTHEFKISKTIFSVNTLLDEILNIKDKQIKQKRLQICREDDPSFLITTDYFYLKVVLSNILDNAIRYTPHEGMIFINFLQLESQLMISVRDTGIGMKRDHILYVFDEFYKVDQSRHDLSSNGLGLPISKYIIEKLQGRIWIASPGEHLGTTVYIELPLDS